MRDLEEQLWHTSSVQRIPLNTCWRGSQRLKDIKKKWSFFVRIPVTKKPHPNQKRLLFSSLYTFYLSAASFFILHVLQEDCHEMNLGGNKPLRPKGLANELLHVSRNRAGLIAWRIPPIGFCWLAAVSDVSTTSESKFPYFKFLLRISSYFCLWITEVYRSLAQCNSGDTQRSARHGSPSPSYTFFLLKPKQLCCQVFKIWIRNS